MEQRKLVLVIPIIVVVGIIAYMYYLGVTEVEEPQVQDSPVKIDQLFGSNWILQSLRIEGQEVTVFETSRVTIQFDEDGEAEGSGGCNTFFGNYQVSGEYQVTVKGIDGEDQTGASGSLSFGAIASTEMACLESGLMEQETQFFSALNTVSSFQVMPGSLVLSNQDEQTFLRFGLE